ncbi:MAG: DNA-formamidopyrimidine glycosylase [Chloroflexota bacterium]
MPELPEVETIRRTLSDTPGLIDQHILGVDLRWERTLAAPGSQEFKKMIVGQKLGAIGRRGKHLLFHLSRETLVIHLRMSGDLLVKKSNEPIAKHDRLLLDFESGKRLAFNDTRKFGRIWLVSEPEELLAHLGPEPLEKSFTPEILFDGLQKYRRQIKPLLLDQQFIAGIGNIYADESLYKARIHPQTRSNMLNLEQAKRLWWCIRDVLKEGIRRNGTSIDWIYRGGDFQNYLQVYQRTSKPCNQCSTPIERIRVGQRGTHFCPQCQPTNEN